MNTHDSMNTTPDLDALVEKWREILSIPNGVTVDIRYHDDLLDGAYFGECNPMPEIRYFPICIRPVDGDVTVWKDFTVERDVEADVVHELLHWMFADIEPPEDTLAYRKWESIIERVAQAIVGIDRACEPERATLYVDADEGKPC